MHSIQKMALFTVLTFISVIASAGSALAGEFELKLYTLTGAPILDTVVIEAVDINEAEVKISHLPGSGPTAWKFKIEASDIPTGKAVTLRISHGTTGTRELKGLHGACTRVMKISATIQP